MADHELPINMNPAELKTHSKLQLRSHSSTLEALPRIEHYDSNETTTKRPSIEDLHAEAQATNFEMADHELPINMKPAELQTHSNLQLRSHSWTLEALPRIENYENIEAATKRPSIEDLHAETHATNTEEKTTQPDQSTIIKGVKLGWIEGVLIPCLLSIWDVMLFLRLSWIVAQAGILQSILIIITASLVCVLTTLSMSAICTNGEVKGGGIYYMISRCLGPEFGTSVGIIFILANVVTASMCTIGFCDSFLDLLGNFGLKIIDGGISDIRIVGFISLLIMIIICAMGMEWESKAQDFLLVIILAAIFDFFIGTIIGPQNEEAKAKGFIGFNIRMKRAQSQYGVAVVFTLQGYKGGDPLLRTYLPDRYTNVLTDERVEEYNTSGVTMDLFKRRNLNPLWRMIPLDFIIKLNKVNNSIIKLNN